MQKNVMELHYTSWHHVYRDIYLQEIRNEGYFQCKIEEFLVDSRVGYRGKVSSLSVSPSSQIFSKESLKFLGGQVGLPATQIR